MTQAFPILQSGFIASSTKGLKLPDPFTPSLQNSVIFKDVKNPLAVYRYSPGVVELYKQWCANSALLRDFNFREQIITQAFISFGTTNFHSWLMLQNMQPTLSDLHKTYILETLDYLLVGTTRKIDNISWMRLLEADNRPNTVAIDIRKYFKQDTMNYSADDVTLPVLTREIIRVWVSKERGFEDLLLSLFIIFGDRMARTAVNNQTS